MMKSVLRRSVFILLTGMLFMQGRVIGAGHTPSSYGSAHTTSIYGAGHTPSMHGAPNYENYDSLFYNSTCINTSIIFGTNIYDSLPFPSVISWDFGDPSSGIYNSAGVMFPVHVYTSPGKYYFSLMVVNGGTTDTVRLKDSITVVSPLTYNFGPDIYLCQGHDTVLQAPIIAGAAYAWNDAVIDDTTTTTDTLWVKKSGVFTVSINGCGVTDSIGVFISDTPRLSLGGNHVMCDSANLLLNATNQNGQYTWTLNGTVLPFTGGQLETTYPGGTYIVSLNVPGCGVHADTAVITYSAPVKPAFSLGGDTLLCPNEVYTLNAEIPGATAYKWDDQSTGGQLTVTQPGTYWVFVTYNGQCQVTDTVLITYRGDQTLNFHDTAICQGGFLVLNADFGQGTYAWTGDPPQRGDQEQTGQAVYYVYNPGKYTIVAQVGQCNYRDSLNVTFDDSLHAYLPKDTTACNGADFSLLVVGNPDTVTWQDGLQALRYPVPQPGGTYTAIAKNGCGLDTLTSVVTFGACACNLIMPNAFTPNGDGRNDVFLPLNFCKMTSYKVTIYDRFGVLIYQSENPELGWDGTFNGKPAFPGNYVWMVSYVTAGAKQPVIKKGNLVLIR